MPGSRGACSEIHRAASGKQMTRSVGRPRGAPAHYNHNLIQICFAHLQLTPDSMSRQRSPIMKLEKDRSRVWRSLKKSARKRLAGQGTAIRIIVIAVKKSSIGSVR